MDRCQWERLSLDEAVRIQNELRHGIVLENREKGEFNTIAGVDLAYWQEEEQELAVCCIVVLDYQTKQVVDYNESIGAVTVPYIPGCLAFRELPLVLETAEKLAVSPDLYLFDGNGYLHPRHMGIATQASFFLDKPTIGVAKSYYKINEVDYDMPENEAGAYTNIVIPESPSSTNQDRSGKEVYGRVLRTQKDVKPIFISAGNYIDLETSTRIVCNMVTKESHIPLPTRLADIETHRARRIYKGA